MKNQQSQTKNKMFKSIEVQTSKIGSDVGVQTETEPFISNKEKVLSPIAESSSQTFNKTETVLTFKKSTPPPRVVPCTSCFGSHIILQELNWPKNQYGQSKYIPISSITVAAALDHYLDHCITH